jgi:hypothetical protein
MSDVGLRVLSSEETEQLTRDRGGAKCGNCRFYEVDGNECRHRSPVRDQNNGLGVWPHVAPTSWCGEYEYLPAHRPGEKQLDETPEQYQARLRGDFS